MNQKLTNVIIFTAGAAIGSLVTWRVVKSYYERYTQEEIDKFVEDWKGRMQHPNVPNDKHDDFKEDDEDEDDYDETEVREYHQLAKKYIGEEEGDDEIPHVNGPVVITPDEFGDGNYDHSLSCLTYYADGVLANDWFETFDIDETIGEEALEHFGDYSTDVVHVRNEQNNADYEVVRDPRTFAEVTAEDPLMARYAT